MNGFYYSPLIANGACERDTTLYKLKERRCPPRRDHCKKKLLLSQLLNLTTNRNGKSRTKKLTELNGEIGYNVKKGSRLVPVRNFSVVCTGYVTENAACGSSKGFHFKVLPKSTLHSEDENPLEERLVRPSIY